MADDPIVGHKTMIDGSHLPLHKSEADAIWAQIEKAQAKRQSDMPTSHDALRMMIDAKERMSDLGWREAIYCPKDGTDFAVCQVGSTGMWRGRYVGKWPDGHIQTGSSASRPEGHFWKSLDALTDEERAHMTRCDADMATMMQAEADRWALMADWMARGGENE